MCVAGAGRMTGGAHCGRREAHFYARVRVGMTGLTNDGIVYWEVESFAGLPIVEQPQFEEHFGAGARGGNVLRAWRQARPASLFTDLVLRQERNLFGSHMEGRVPQGIVRFRPDAVDLARAILAEVGVELVVEP